MSVVIRKNPGVPFVPSQGLSVEGRYFNAFVGADWDAIVFNPLLFISAL
ncbi:hypothetical protein [Phormidesmis priestleyi]